MIDIWYINIKNYSNESYAEDLKGLPKGMQQELQRQNSIQEKKLKLLGRLIIRFYEHEKGRDFSWKHWKLGEFGKPYVEGAAHFSISHSEDIVAVAFASDELGLDLEKHVSVDIQSISNYVHPEERNYISQSEDKLTSWFYVWTRKEAFLKAIGRGLQTGTNQENCLESPTWKGETWSIHSEVFLDEYALALCTHNQQTLVYREIDPSFVSDANSLR